MDTHFSRIERLPPYVFNIIGELRTKQRRAGNDIIDFGMGNPDQPTPTHIVNKLVEAAQRENTHRYSLSKGIPRLRKALCDRYQQHYGVQLNEEDEAIVTIGSKEGIAHLALAITGPGDTVLVPDPCYPIHTYGFVIAGADVRHVPLNEDIDAFFERLKIAITETTPRPKALVLNFPSNPTTQCVDIGFFEEVVSICQKHNIWIIHDLAYADIVFEGDPVPSILQVKGAKDICVECYSLSKTYNMPGWRVGFMAGNRHLIHALARIKSYMDYGTFTPVQIAAIHAMESDQSCVTDIVNTYRERRDTLCHGLNQCGWEVTPPRATMMVWAKIPEHYRSMGSVEFAKRLINEAHVAVSPGIGFGSTGDAFVRFSLIENPHRTRQAVRGIRNMMRADGAMPTP